MRSGGIFDVDLKQERLEEVTRELEDPEVWNQPEKAQALGKERSQLDTIVSTLQRLTGGLSDVADLLELAVDENDEETLAEVIVELDELEQAVVDAL